MTASINTKCQNLQTPVTSEESPIFANNKIRKLGMAACAIIPAIEGWRQEDKKLEASLGYKSVSQI